MKNYRRSTAILVVVILASAAMFVGCSSTTSVDTNDAVTAPTFELSTSCPPMESLAEAIAIELNTNCPITTPYRNWGQENSCEKRTIGQMLEGYESCYTEAELKELRTLVLQIRRAAYRDPRIEPPTRMEE